MVSYWSSMVWTCKVGWHENYLWADNEDMNLGGEDKISGMVVFPCYMYYKISGMVVFPCYIYYNLHVCRIYSLFFLRLRYINKLDFLFLHHRRIRWTVWRAREHPRSARTYVNVIHVCLLCHQTHNIIRPTISSCRIPEGGRYNHYHYRTGPTSYCGKTSEYNSIIQLLVHFIWFSSSYWYCV